MNMIEWLSKLFCNHDYEFAGNIRDIYKGYHPAWKGYESIWVCKKCGKIKYRKEFVKDTTISSNEVPNINAKYLNNLCDEYYLKIYYNWKEFRKEILKQILNGMTENARNGLYNYEILLACDEVHDDFSYYIKWLHELNLKVSYKILNNSYGANTILYRFVIDWKK